MLSNLSFISRPFIFNNVQRIIQQTVLQRTLKTSNVPKPECFVENLEDEDKGIVSSVVRK